MGFCSGNFQSQRKLLNRARLRLGRSDLGRIGTGNTGPGNYIGQGRVRYRRELVGRLLIILSSYCHKKYRKPKNKGLETDTVWKCQAATASEDCEPETLNQ